MTFNVCIYVQKVLAAESLSRREGWQVLSKVCVYVCTCAVHTRVYTTMLL